MVTQPQRYRFSLAEYDRMVERGIFPEDVRLELIDGEIIQMAPIGDRHVDFVRRFRRAFARLEDDGLVVLSVQDPIRLKDRHEPQPDLTILRPRASGYARLAEAEDILLVIEVADSTLDHDRRKAWLYADAGIPEYWLVNVGTDPATMIVYREPQPDGYHSIHVVRAGGQLAPLAFPEVNLDTERLLK